MSAIAGRIAKKTLAGKAQAYEPADPHYETYTDAQGNTRSRQRQMPQGLSKRDERILRSVRRRAHYLDKGFSLCGFRFGWSAIFGLVPVRGFSILPHWQAARHAAATHGLQFSLSFQDMCVSIGIGMVPLVGDIGVAVLKANSRNAALLEEFLIARAAKSAEGVAPTAATEDAAAQQVLAGGGSKIDARTGERKGGASGVGVASSSSTLDAPTGEVVVPAPAAGPAPASSSTPRKYGWGSSSAAAATSQDQKPLMAANKKTS